MMRMMRIRRRLVGPRNKERERGKVDLVEAAARK
jgi:hypothetical protein